MPCPIATSFGCSGWTTQPALMTAASQAAAPAQPGLLERATMRLHLCDPRLNRRLAGCTGARQLGGEAVDLDLGGLDLGRLLFPGAEVHLTAVRLLLADGRVCSERIGPVTCLVVREAIAHAG